jgi:calcineurin-like phosphoesterase family protein
MTRIFFTADYHLDHANIIRFCNRPFIREGDLDKSTNHWVSEEIKEKRKQEMNLAIVKNHNRVIKEEDIVYDLGDFCFKSTGGAKYWEQQLNGTIVHIRGNHDKNNSVKSYITHAILEFGGCKIYATHTPPDPEQKDTIEGNLIDLCDFILCGHVHGLWKHTMIRNKICINVGVDVWNFEPVSIHSILKYLAKTKRCDLK